jgi:hypothetical protein
MLVKSILIWLSMLPLAILNGGLRDKIIAPLIGMEYARPISAFTLCLLIFVVSLLFIPKLGKGSRKDYIFVGLLWISLTIIFETGMGLSLGNRLEEIIAAYNITTGDLWLLVVIFIGIVPYLSAKIRHII